MKYIKFLAFYMVSFFGNAIVFKAFTPIRNDFTILSLIIASAFLAIILYSLFQIMQANKTQIEIREIAFELLAEYKDESVLVKTPIAYHSKFNRLEKLLSDEK